MIIIIHSDDGGFNSCGLQGALDLALGLLRCTLSLALQLGCLSLGFASELFRGTLGALRGAGSCALDLLCGGGCGERQELAPSSSEKGVQYLGGRVVFIGELTSDVDAVYQLV